MHGGGFLSLDLLILEKLEEVILSNFSKVASIFTGEPSTLLALQNSVRGLLASFAPFHTQALYEACLPYAKCVTFDQFMRRPALKTFQSSMSFHCGQGRCLANLLFGIRSWVHWRSIEKHCLVGAGD
ncbi:uncharacterized protein LOC131243117 [Magnolia sinica]|uniref:uncharacterized protein LOC131243117 n=1 Tax=Magnolia sinica TaxID=86752 RepID=UPI002658CCA5|nr:uncharacterized protein LOC131243117 [Magnolia sinica]